MTDQKQTAPDDPRNGAPLWVRGAVRLVAVCVFISIPLFWGAGTLDWPRGWVFLALLASTFILNMTLVLAKNPTLMRERWKRRKDTKRFDKVFGWAYLVAVPAFFVLAGMDSVRFRWTSMQPSLLYVGVAMHVLGMIPVLGALLTNPHLETTVRIQTDREHRVVMDGPYRYVRHPMYVGISLAFWGWSLILGSWVAFGVACVVVVLLVVRTALEDETLRNELPGYIDYCEKTRYRLIPGVW
jgi:protein-S-isoprenylcysteine O-methyltransferase Ste14